MKDQEAAVRMFLSTCLDLSGAEKTSKEKFFVIVEEKNCSSLSINSLIYFVIQEHPLVLETAIVPHLTRKDKLTLLSKAQAGNVSATTRNHGDNYKPLCIVDSQTVNVETGL